jgi:GT2 family glycosyltransferase
MAVHDGARHLQASLDSVLDQSFGDFELVVVDDGSTDDTPQILRSYTDKRIRVIDNPRNLGLTASLNRGLAASRGELLARQDADDVSLPGRLARQVEFLRNNRDVVLLGSAYIRINELGEELGTRNVPTEDDEIRWRMLFLNPYTHSSVMFRTDAARRVGGYRTDYPYAEDYDLWARLAAAHPVAAVPEILVLYRKSDTSLMATTGREHGTAPELARRLREDLMRECPSRQKLDLTVEEADAAWRLLFGNLDQVDAGAGRRVASKLVRLRKLLEERRNTGSFAARRRLALTQRELGQRLTILGKRQRNAAALAEGLRLRWLGEVNAAISGRANVTTRR